METNYQKEIEVLNYSISKLSTEIHEMRQVFHVLAKPIKEKAVYSLIDKLQNIQEEAFQIGNDRTLNSYEELCLMIQDGSIENYRLVLQKMWDKSMEVSIELSSVERFIITHYCVHPDFLITAELEIYSDFHIYVCEFGSKRVDNFSSILW